MTTPPEGASTPLAPRARRSGGMRRFLFPVLAVLLVGFAALGYNIYWQSVHYVSTDNAQVAGQPIAVGSMNAGRVASVETGVGSSVSAGDVIARLELPSAVRVLQNGSPDLEFLAADQVVDIKAPMSGVVADVPAAVGATVAQGEALVTLIDPTLLWVSASIDENQVSRLHVGQMAQVHLDALNADVAGVVADLTPATSGAFALLPQANTTTNFTKVAQVVPVRISVQLQNHPGLLGSSAEVKIRVS